MLQWLVSVKQWCQLLNLKERAVIHFLIPAQCIRYRLGKQRSKYTYDPLSHQLIRPFACGAIQLQSNPPGILVEGQVQHPRKDRCNIQSCWKQSLKMAGQNSCQGHVTCSIAAAGLIPASQFWLSCLSDCPPAWIIIVDTASGWSSNLF